MLMALSAARVAWRRAARRRVGVALAVDAAVGRREDVVNLPKRGDGLVEVEAKCDEVVDRGLRHSSPGADGDYSEAAREVPLPRGAGGRWRDPGEDGRVWACSLPPSLSTAENGDLKWPPRSLARPPPKWQCRPARSLAPYLHLVTLRWPV